MSLGVFRTSRGFATSIVKNKVQIVVKTHKAKHRTIWLGGTEQ